MEKCFIQVAYLLPNKATIECKYGAFSPISNSSLKYVLSLDKIDMSREGIAHLNFLIMNFSRNLREKLHGSLM